MANFYINIIDNEDDTHVTAVELAEKKSIKLSYKGKDAKQDLQIIGSELRFKILVPISVNMATDAALLHLFTADEQRYTVELRKESDDALLWTGHLLPDQYQEPYKRGNAFINLVATDGLGRLKGRYLTADFYSEEKSVTEIIGLALQGTDKKIPLIFAPAIDNRLEKDWSKIYIDTSQFITDNKRKNCYEILEMLLSDLVACVYQHLGQWYIEGLNKRNLKEYAAIKYNGSGDFLQNITVTKVEKDISGGVALVTPSVTMVPNFGVIEIENKPDPLAFPETISIEKNEGWSPGAGVHLQVYASDWFGTSSFLPKAKDPDYKVYLKGSDAVFDEDNFIKLQRKLYVKGNQKLKLKLDFSIDFDGEESDTVISNLVNANHWTNPVYYEIKLNGTVLFSNNTVATIDSSVVQFTRDKKSTNTFQFIPLENGLLDVVIYQPFGDIDTNKIDGIFIDALTIEEIGFTENVFYTETSEASFTVVVEQKLNFADDASGLGKAFRLAKLDANNTTQFNTVNIPVLGGFTQNGNFYSVVTLRGANLIADNIESVSYNSNDLLNLEVIYNYQGGEQMVVKTMFAITSGNFVVTQYKKQDFDLDRTHWEQWTDSVYVIETKRYGNAVKDVYKRILEAPHPKVDLTVNAPILFADVIKWNYRAEAFYQPTNLTIDFDTGKTTLTMAQNTYLNAGVLIPPIVDAGPDIYLNNGQEEVTLDATAYDPDGEIVSTQWQVLSGTPTPSFNSNTIQDPTVSGLTGDAYELQITVTDNDGLTASDTVQILRAQDFAISFTPISEGGHVTVGSVEDNGVYRLTITPQLPADASINLTVKYDLETSVNPIGAFTNALAGIELRKNGLVLENETVTEINTYLQEYNINYIDGDIIDVDMVALAEATASNDAFASANFIVEAATIIDYPGTVTGLPANIQVLAQIQG